MNVSKERSYELALWLAWAQTTVQSVDPGKGSVQRQNR